MANADRIISLQDNILRKKYLLITGWVNVLKRQLALRAFN